MAPGQQRAAGPAGAQRGEGTQGTRAALGGQGESHLLGAAMAPGQQGRRDRRGLSWGTGRNGTRAALWGQGESHLLGAEWPRGSNGGTGGGSAGGGDRGGSRFGDIKRPMGGGRHVGDSLRRAGPGGAYKLCGLWPKGVQVGRASGAERVDGRQAGGGIGRVACESNQRWSTEQLETN